MLRRASAHGDRSPTSSRSSFRSTPRPPCWSRLHHRSEIRHDHHRRFVSGLVLVVPLVGSLADSIDPAAMASLLGVTRADILMITASFRRTSSPSSAAWASASASPWRASSASSNSRRSSVQAVRAGRFELGGQQNPSRRYRTHAARRDVDASCDPDRARLDLRLLHFRTARRLGTVRDGHLVVFVISFLFTTVAANAIAIIGATPCGA